MNPGCYTAIITPFAGEQVDQEGLDRLIGFQIENGVSGIVAVGTTGESPTLSWEEHIFVIDYIAKQTAKQTNGKIKCIAGTGSNNTKETLVGSEHAAKAGVEAVLLVDPYYNGPSSMEIRKEYYEPVAKAFPELDIIPYIIPGRTGAQIFPEDVAILAAEYKNINTVKEASGNMDNIKKTRKFCGESFTILSGDDPVTLDLMLEPEIKGGGAISVMSNIVPKAVSDMIAYAMSGETEKAKDLNSALKPLFDVVMVKTMEMTSYGEVLFRARNPLPVKTLMAVLGMPSGGLRKPLGKMTKKSLDVVLEAVKKVWSETPQVLKPIETYFGVSIDERLSTPALWGDVIY